MNNEPAVSANAIVAIIEAGLVMLVALGIVTLDDIQTQAIMAFVAAAVPVGASVWVRSQVVPLGQVSEIANDMVRQRMARMTSDAELRGPQHGTV